MSIRYGFYWQLLAASFALLLPAFAGAQTDSRLSLGEWPNQTWGLTVDNIVYQARANIETSPDHVNVFWWDSIGRFRLDSNDANSPDIGYRYVTTTFTEHSSILPAHLDELSAAMALHFGEMAGGKVSLVFGAGYSSNNPFADAQDIFGIGHLIYDRKLNDSDSLVLSLDYNGVNAFLPDIPLPGFEYIHHTETFTIAAGFPHDEIKWEMCPHLTLDAGYSVPYTADVELSYQLSHSFSIFGGYHNFFNAYRLADEPRTNRFFYQMSRAEIGVRYINPDFVLKGAYFDAGLAVGYAFDQDVSSGFDVRDNQSLGAISDVPYASLWLRGRF